MPLPVAHGLIGASIVIASRAWSSWRENWWPLLVGMVLAISPDFDLFFAWVLKYNIQIHGSFTHSIVFAVVLGFIGAGLAKDLNWRGIKTYTLIALSHGLLDVCTKKEFGGAQLLWPFSMRKIRLDLFSYYEFYPESGRQSLWLVLQEVVIISLREALVCLPVLLVVIWWKGYSRQPRVI